MILLNRNCWDFQSCTRSFAESVLLSLFNNAVCSLQTRQNHHVQTAHRSNLPWTHVSTLHSSGSLNYLKDQMTAQYLSPQRTGFVSLRVILRSGHVDEYNDALLHWRSLSQNSLIFLIFVRSACYTSSTPSFAAAGTPQARHSHIDDPDSVTIHRI